jgi:hypothetical protein
MTLPRINFRRQITGISLFIIILLASISRVDFHTRTQKSWDPKKAGQDAITIWDQRLKAFAPYLPEHGTIGYRDDRSIPGREVNDLDASGEYTLTRYALAPLIVQDDPKQVLVVGNFSFGSDPPSFDKLGFTVIKQFDYELFLLKRTSK